MATQGKTIVERLELNKTSYKVWQNTGEEKYRWAVKQWGQEKGSGTAASKKEAVAEAVEYLLANAKAIQVNAKQRMLARQKLKGLVERRWYLCAAICEQLGGGIAMDEKVIVKSAKENEQGWLDMVKVASIRPRHEPHHLWKPTEMAAQDMLDAFRILGIVGSKAVNKWAVESLGPVYRWPKVKSQKELIDNIRLDMEDMATRSASKNAKKRGPEFDFPDDEENTP